jgi:hypothetical protein
MYAGVLFVAAVGAVAARLRPAGMARAMAGAAAAQGIVGVVALVGGLGQGGAALPGDVIAATIVFVCLWGASALLFRAAAKRNGHVGARRAGYTRGSIRR